VVGPIELGLLPLDRLLGALLLMRAHPVGPLGPGLEGARHGRGQRRVSTPAIPHLVLHYGFKGSC
jgi:hypothetical protein